MTQYTISKNTFNTSGNAEPYDKQDNFIDCSEFRFAVCEHANVLADDSSEQMHIDQDKLLNTIKANIGDHIYNSVVEEYGSFTTEYLDQYIHLMANHLKDKDRYIADEYTYCYDDGYITRDEVDTLYHIATYLKYGRIKPVPTDFDYAHIEIDKFESVWNADNGKDRFTTEDHADVSQQKTFVREIDYFGTVEGVNGRAKPMRYELNGDKITATYSTHYADPSGFNSVTTTYIMTNDREAFLGLETVDGRRVATFKNNAWPTVGGDGTDDYADILEISWNPHLTHTDDPEVAIRTWYGGGTPDGKVVASYADQAEKPDLDRDGYPEHRIVVDESPYIFVPKSAEQPDGIDENQLMTNPNGKPTSHSRVGISHTNIGQKVKTN